MIFIDKPVAPPAVLSSRGVVTAATHCTDHDAAPADYRSGAKKFEFDATIYAAPEVKDVLRTAQQGKCAFCESFVPHIGYGDVEHYRPKAGYKQRKGDTLKRPGYYWLAYDWDNLFFACQLCNEQFKRNLFPLKQGHQRARHHSVTLTDEEPLLIHPVRIDPTAHIEFRQERVVGVTAEGKESIRVLGLKRAALSEARGRRLQSLKNLRRVRDLLQDRIAAAPTAALRAELVKIESAITAARESGAEYAAMARAYLGS